MKKFTNSTICRRSIALAGDNESAIKPRRKDTRPKSILPAKELIELIVARCSLSNSFCINVLLATVATPKKTEVDDMSSGDRTVGNAAATMLAIILEI